MVTKLRLLQMFCIKILKRKGKIMGKKYGEEEMFEIKLKILQMLVYFPLKCIHKHMAFFSFGKKNIFF